MRDGANGRQERGGKQRKNIGTRTNIRLFPSCTFVERRTQFASRIFLVNIAPTPIKTLLARAPRNAKPITSSICRTVGPLVAQSQALHSCASPAKAKVSRTPRGTRAHEPSSHPPPSIKATPSAARPSCTAPIRPSEPPPPPARSRPRSTNLREDGRRYNRLRARARSSNAGSQRIPHSQPGSRSIKQT